MNEIKKDVILLPYQEEFFRSPARYSAIIAAIGTGKTYSGLLRAWDHCNKYPNSLGLIVRKEFVDLKTSTMKDFEDYFNVGIASDKTYTFPNGSRIMFTHGDLNDVNVLKNINLSFFLIEQAEEYETDEIFDFLRDRLRRKNAGPRWGSAIANAHGHNWMFHRFIAGAEAHTIDEKTGQYVYIKNNRYLCSTANTFANEANLPEDFVEDCRAMETEAPQHFFQYIMNDFNVVEEDDLVFTQEELSSMKTVNIDGTIINHCAGIDVARFGKDLSVCVGVENVIGMKFRESIKDSWGQKDAIYTSGRISDFIINNNVEVGVIDADGLGGPIYDIVKGLVNSSSKLGEFHGGMPAIDKHYANIKTEGFFFLKTLASKGWLEVHSQDIINELSTIRYKFNRKGQKIIISKDEMRKKGIPSPNFADALMMGVWLANNKKMVYKKNKNVYNNNKGNGTGNYRINDPKIIW